MLEEEDGVVVADGALQQSFRVVGVGDADDLEPRYVHEVALGALSVLCAAVRRADRRSHHERHRDLAARHVAQLRGLVHELVHALEEEVGVLHVGDRAHPECGCAHRGAGDHLLADRRVDDAVIAELLRQPEVDAECTAEPTLDADVLADQEDGLVATHLFCDRLA